MKNSKLTIAQLRALKFNNGFEDLTVVKRNGNTVWLRNQYASIITTTVSNLFDNRYYSIIN